ncbi:hypothetical protein Tco_1369124 [Tanacetum coccineum]
MVCRLSHTIDEIQALVIKLIDEEIIRQKALMELAVQFENASTAKSDFRKTYEKCNDITQESRALIDTFLKQESNKDYEMNLAHYRKAAKKKNKLRQLLLDEEVLRETLKEEARAEKEWEEKIKKEQAKYELFKLEFRMASSSSSSTFLIKFHRGGVFVRDPFSYDFEILFEIPNVDLITLGYVGFVKLLVSECSSDIKQIFYRVPGLDFELGLKPLKNDADLVECIECGTKNDYALHIYVSHYVFDLHDATATTSQQNVDTESDLEDDYNIFDYNSSEESDTASVDHFSEGEEEVFRRKASKMFDENFLSRVYKGLPSDEYIEKDVVISDQSADDNDNLGDQWPIHDPSIK